MEPKVVQVFWSMANAAAFDAVYRRIVFQDPLCAGFMKSRYFVVPPQEDPRRTELARQISAVWAATRHYAGQWRDTLRGDPMGGRVAMRVLNCPPGGARVEGGSGFICGLPFICPHCRYRQARKAAAHILSGWKDRGSLFMTSTWGKTILPVEGSQWPELREDTIEALNNCFRPASNLRRQFGIERGFRAVRNDVVWDEQEGRHLFRVIMCLRGYPSRGTPRRKSRVVAKYRKSVVPCPTSKLKLARIAASAYSYNRLLLKMDADLFIQGIRLWLGGGVGCKNIKTYLPWEPQKEAAPERVAEQPVSPPLSANMS